MRIDPVRASKGMGELNSKMISKELRVSNKDSNENLDQVKDSKDISNFIKDFKKKVSKFHDVMKSELKFEIDRDLNMIIVKIKDKDTGEIIRQIPAEVVVKLAKAIEEFLGVILDERV